MISQYQNSHLTTDDQCSSAFNPLHHVSLDQIHYLWGMQYLLDPWIHGNNSIYLIACTLTFFSSNWKGIACLDSCPQSISSSLKLISSELGPVLFKKLLCPSTFMVGHFFHKVTGVTVVKLNPPLIGVVWSYPCCLLLWVKKNCLRFEIDTSPSLTSYQAYKLQGIIKKAKLTNSFRRGG